MPDIFSPSPEQQKIIDLAVAGHDLLIEAVPGAGKTTTMMNLARSIPDKFILLLTYNTLLKSESRKKQTELGIKNLEIHTFHSWVKKYLAEDCFDDVSLYEALQLDEIYPEYDLVIVDEAQDLKPLYFDLVQKILTPETQLILSGDPMQSIYRYDGATADYLQNVDGLWKRNFEHVYLRTSYRLTRQMAAFINEAILGRDLIRAVRDGPPVTYIIGDSYKVQTVEDIITKHRREHNHSDGDFFIGNYSLKMVNNEKPIHRLENSLVKHGFKFYRPRTDSSECKETQLRGKIALTTYHQSKGRERAVVVCYGVDDSFYKYYNPSGEYLPERCPEPLYVKLTRARESLYCIHDRKHSLLPFFKMSLQELSTKPWFKLIDQRDPTKTYIPCKPSPRSELTVSVKDFCSRLSFQHLLEFKKYISTAITIVPTDGIKDIHIASTVPTKGDSAAREDISDLNGFIISLLHAVRAGYTPSLFKLKDHPELTRHLRLDSTKQPTVETMAKLAALYDAVSTKFHHRIKQISRYDWIPESTASVAVNNIQRVARKVCGNPKHWESSCCSIKKGPLKINLVGSIEFYDPDRQVLLATHLVPRFDSSHYIQLLVYGWLHHMTENKVYDLYLYNICKDELVRVAYDPDKINRLVKSILMHKYNT